MWRWGRIGLGLAVALGLASCGLLVWIAHGQGLGPASSWAGVLAAAAGVVAAVAAVWPLLARPSRVRPLAGLEVPGWVVDRPAEAGQVVAALMADGGRPVGITTGLHGAGGFGKTTLARVVCADRRVRHRFRGGVFLVTVGRDVRGAAAVAAKVNDVIKAVAGEEATFTDPDLAGSRLGALLEAGPRRLLVVDDVWEAGQLAPFTAGGRKCARLVTTRAPHLLGGQAVAVRVDQMSPEQAGRLLRDGLPSLDPLVVGGLLAVTGRWPLLLRLVNKILADAAGAGADTAAVAAELLGRLRVSGPAVVDNLLGDATEDLDVGQPGQRARAVRATIEASTSLLGREDAHRFSELSVFAEDEIIPFGLAAVLWRATAGLEQLEATRVCGRLAGLGLVTVHHAGGEANGVALHDVVRDFLRGELGNQRLAELHGVLLDAAAARLPASGDLAGRGAPAGTAWWELGQGDRYLLDHLIEHLIAAGRRGEADDVACDLRWVGARLRAFGPAAPAADLSLIGAARAIRLRMVLTRAAHLLAATEPAGAVVDVLCSRVAGDPEWGPRVAALRDLHPVPRLVNRWPLPDLPNPALRRLIVGDRRVSALAVAPDGSWLVTGGSDGMVRIWDTATGQVRVAFNAHRKAVLAVAVAPDGSWLATSGSDRKARIWDPATGEEQAVVASSGMSAVAVSPDGGWLAIGNGRRVRIWDAATRTERARSDVGRAGWVTAVAISPDGSWLATGSLDRGAQIWDAATGMERIAFLRHDVIWRHGAPDRAGGALGAAGRAVRAWMTAARELPAMLVARGGEDWVTAVAVAPDGTWLAAGGLDGTVRIWDVPSGRQRAALSGHAGPVMAMAVAPDGSWLATAFSDGMVRIWDLATGKEQAVLPGHGDWVTAIAVAPDGSWMAAASSDGTVSIWDVAAGRSRAKLTEHAIWTDAVAALPDGGSLVTSGPDRQVRIWDVATRNERLALCGHSAAVAAIAVAPDGSWLATAGGDPEVPVWDTATGSKRAVLAGHGVWTAAVAAAPDGSWLATGGYDGVVRLRDVATGKERAAFGAHRARGRAAEIAPRWWLAIRGYDRITHLRDVASGEEQWSVLIGHRAATYAITISPDGAWLAVTGLDPVVQLWDIPTGKRRLVLTGHHNEVYTAAAAPDGSWLATGGRDGTVRIWDTAAARQRTVLTGHRGPVYAVAVAPDGCWLASGGSDGTVRIWDTARWQAQTLMRVDGQIFTCTWLGAGGLACGGQAGLYVFDFLGGINLRPAPVPATGPAGISGHQ